MRTRRREHGGRGFERRSLDRRTRTGACGIRHQDIGFQRRRPHRIRGLGPGQRHGRFKRLAHGHGVGVAVGGLLLGCALDNGHKSVGKRHFRGLAYRGHRLELVREQDRHRGVLNKRRPPRHTRVQDAPQRVQVRAPVRHLAAPLLGAHVRGRAQRGAGLGERRALHARDAEVEHLDHGRLTDHLHQDEVAGLQVAVHQPRGVRLGEAAQDLDADGRGLKLRERATVRCRLFQSGVERGAAELLHRHKEDAGVRLAKVVDANGIGVAERRGDAGLLQEALHQVLFHTRGVADHDLDRRRLAGHHVLGRKYGAKAALTEDPLDAVAAADHIAFGQRFPLGALQCAQERGGAVRRAELELGLQAAAWAIAGWCGGGRGHTYASSEHGSGQRHGAAVWGIAGGLGSGVVMSGLKDATGQRAICGRPS